MSLDNSLPASYEDDDIYLIFEDDIVYGRYKVEHVTMDVAIKARDYRMQLSGGKLHGAISDIRWMSRMDQDVRDFLATPEACENIVAGAIIVKSTFQKIAGNFYILVSKPQVPARIFTSIPDAKQWLEKFKIAELKNAS